MADPTSFSWSVLDDEGLPNNIQMYVAYDGATETVDALIGGWTAFGGLIDPCIDGKLTGGSITIPLIRNPAWKAAPVNGNNVNQIMNLGFDNDFNSFITTVDLCSYKEALLTPQHIPDLTDPALAALVAAIIAGSGAIFPNSRDLHDLNALRKAFLTVGKVRNQKAKTTVTP